LGKFSRNPCDSVVVVGLTLAVTSLRLIDHGVGQHGRYQPIIDATSAVDVVRRLSPDMQPKLQTGRREATAGRTPIKITSARPSIAILSNPALPTR